MESKAPDWAVTPETTVTLRLSGYHLHELFAELEFCCQFANRDVERPRRLLQVLAAQCGIELTFASAPALVQQTEQPKSHWWQNIARL